jgi:DNA excision repair protein ERCC-4
MYKQSGVFCITSRILIVDLLSNVADAKDIDGLLIAHAENVTEQSTDAFILRIFHSQKLTVSSTEVQGGKTEDPPSPNQQNATPKTGFVKAFTNSPDALMSGFGKVDKILKSLRVRRLYLYPRFHDGIRRELEKAPPHVDELHQELSPTMKEIQNSIAAAVQGCIRELKSSTTLLEWTDADLSVENCVTANFERAISRQLEHDWHRLKPQTKQMVQDLKVLRTLFQSLIQYDCVSFWKLLNSIKAMGAASRNPSMWLLMPAADMLFRKAKERIYKVEQGRPTAKVAKPVAKLKPVLEETPKWKLLRQVLGEIQEEEVKKKETKNESGNSNLEAGPVNVLVMVKDEKTVEAIRAYLVDGRSRSMMLRWLRYLELVNDRSRSIADVKDMSAISEESRLLLEEEGRVRRVLFGKSGPTRKGKAGAKDDKGKRKKQLNELPDYTRKRRRIATEKGRGRLTTGADDLAREAVLDEAVEKTEHEMDGSVREVAADDDNDGLDDDDDEDDKLMFDATMPEELRVIVRSHASIDGEESIILLNDLRPSYIVLYDADISFIRAMEIYSALSSASRAHPLRVFFLIFEASAEEKTFTRALEKEQNAFERLIRHKQTMPPPALQNIESQEMQQAKMMGMIGGSYMNGSLPLAFDTRQGRGKAKASTETRDIAVDVREFRSALPSILHQGGMRLAPVTLIVGDFVLSSVHCVERKSISDLFGSFNSGRLHEQATAMCKYYKCPCLLIEFDPNKSFCLQNSNELGVEIKQDSICSKMVVLTRHFPKLRILWSRSPHHTLDIFKELKSNHDEVNVERAMEVGRSESVEAFCQETSEDNEVNEMARDMLMRLPGVTIAIARKIMDNVDSLAELSAMSREELRKVAGPVAGQKLFTFFRQKMAAT